MIHEVLSEDIVSAAMAVLNALKSGLDKKLYETGLLVIELSKRAHTVSKQKQFPVYYGEK